MTHGISANVALSSGGIFSCVSMAVLSFRSCYRVYNQSSYFSYKQVSKFEQFKAFTANAFVGIGALCLAGVAGHFGARVIAPGLVAGKAIETAIKTLTKVGLGLVAAGAIGLLTNGKMPNAKRELVFLCRERYLPNIQCAGYGDYHKTIPTFNGPCCH